MTMQAPLSGEARWFHGTPFEIARGSLVEPGHDPSFGTRDEVEENQPVYMSNNPHAAAAWAEEALEERRARSENVSGLRPRVYEVTPTGPHHTDPANEWEHTPDYIDRYSHHPLLVLHEVSADAGKAPWRQPGYKPATSPPGPAPGAAPGPAPPVQPFHGGAAPAPDDFNRSGPGRQPGPGCRPGNPADSAGRSPARPGAGSGKFPARR